VSAVEPGRIAARTFAQSLEIQSYALVLADPSDVLPPSLPSGKVSFVAFIPMTPFEELGLDF